MILAAGGHCAGAKRRVKGRPSPSPRANGRVTGSKRRHSVSMEALRRVGRSARPKVDRSVVAVLPRCDSVGRSAS